MIDIEVRRLVEWRRSLVFAAWLASCAEMILLSWNSIHNWNWPDPDDPLRLVEVRDWLAGQSWFDVTQYRMNAPDGVLMHWSRLVDAPLAAVILVFRPLVGEQNAELAAAVLVPLITLGVVTLLMSALARRLLNPETALLATVATPFCIGAWVQMPPLRIDHHGWQIAAGMLAVVAVMDDRRKRSALVAAAAMALWLNISVEGLPFAAAVGGVFALRWLKDPAAVEALQFYFVGLAGFSFFLFGITHTPVTWTDQDCDAVSLPHLAA
jgi:asparagine N-glycosylation enzyme membrane subunit Stt3